MTPQFKFKLKQFLATMSNIGTWENIEVVDGEPWTTGATPSKILNSVDDVSDLLRGNLIGATAGDYSFTIDYNLAATGDPQIVQMEVFLIKDDELNTVVGSESFSIIGTGDKTEMVVVTASEPPTWVAFKLSIAFPLAGTFTRTVTINAVTLNGSEQIIREPIGWKEAILKQERDPKFHSLIEFFEMPIGFYGAALTTVRNLESVHGLDYKLGMSVEIQYDPDIGYELLFDGLIDISPIDENYLGDTPYKAKLALIRDDLWAKLMNNKDTPVDVQGTEDLFGQSVTPMAAKTLNLPSQRIRYEGEYNRINHGWIADHDDNDKLIIIDFDEVVRDDFKKYELSIAAFAENADFSNLMQELAYIPGLVPAPWDGYYNVDIRIEAGNFRASDSSWVNFTNDTRFYIGIAGRPSIDIIDVAGEQFNNYTRLTQTVINNGGQFLHVYEFNGTFKLKKGQQIAIFAYHQEDTGNLNIFGSRLQSWKTDCRVATTGNVVLAGSQVIDGVTVVAGDRVLVKDQDDPKENGIWAVDAGPVWTRAGDSDSGAELENATVFVEEGELWGGTYWIQETENVVLGTSELEFVLTEYNDTKLTAYPGTDTPDTHLIITADTTFKDSTTEAFLIHDVGKAVLDRVAGIDKFFSSFMGNTEHVASTIGEYTEAGSAFRYMLVKGNNLKGLPLSQKKFFHSLMEWFDNLNAILNIGLGYTEINGSSAIEVEKKEDFYDSSSNSVEFYNVDKMIRRYDLELQFKKVEIGYRTGKTDTISGNNDPHRIATYSTKLSRVGREIPMISSYIAAPTLIEETRRQSVEQSKDYKLDDETFIIAINPTAVAEDTFTPELTENFSSISGILNAETKYNYRLWPVWNLIRWMNFFNGALQKYATSIYRFVKGEGNYDAAASMDPASEDLLTGSPVVSQSGNITVNTSSSRGQHIHSDELYECIVPMSWEQYKLIRDNRKKSIGISRNSEATVPYFIKDLQFHIVKGEATLIVWPKDSQVSSVSYSPDSLLLETGEFILLEDGSTITLEN